MMIERTLKKNIINAIQNSNQIIILYGARQVGKTTLIQSIIKKLSYKTISINADEKKYIDILSSRDLKKMQMLIAGFELLFIDEAQRIPDIGINLKILHDAYPNLKIIATGSSSFELANKIKEPLTGRTRTFYLYPISCEELSKFNNLLELDFLIQELLIYGTYPSILNTTNQKDKYLNLKELSESYLYKDILEIADIKHSRKIRDLLRLIAFQIGNLVSLTELGNTLEMSKDTVCHYIDLLEKSNVIFRLSGFSRNLRKEISKMDKIYFNDLGIRNILIDNINPLEQRNDIGALWENFLIIERKKLLNNHLELRPTYFWRTYTGAEIDYIEEFNGQLSGFEIKFNNKTSKSKISWNTHYPEANFDIINKENYQTFICSLSFNPRARHAPARGTTCRT